MAHILIVDDIPSNCETMKALLEADGHTIQTAHYSTEVDDIMRSRPVFDLVIMDFNLAEQITGGELLDKYAQHWKRAIIATAEPHRGAASVQKLHLDEKYEYIQVFKKHQYTIQNITEEVKKALF